jgi:hypothetical protein
LLDLVYLYWLQSFWSVVCIGIGVAVISPCPRRQIPSTSARATEDIARGHQSITTVLPVNKKHALRVMI